MPGKGEFAVDEDASSDLPSNRATRNSNEMDTIVTTLDEGTEDEVHSNDVPVSRTNATMNEAHQTLFQRKMYLQDFILKEETLHKKRALRRGHDFSLIQ